MEAMIVAVGTGAAAAGGAAGFAADAGIGDCVGSIGTLLPMVRKGDLEYLPSPVWTKCIKDPEGRSTVFSND
jgi:hypothetical protein